MGQGKVKGHFRREKIVLTTSIISAIIVLGILVFVHELGHFILAKRLGVGVITFSLGFGPKLIGRKIGETQYQIAAVPLGGFVKLIGENPEEEVKEEDRARSFSAATDLETGHDHQRRPFLQLLSRRRSLLHHQPLRHSLPSLARSERSAPGLPAETAGLKKGDIVLSIDGEKVSKWDDLSRIIRNSKGKELTIKVKRDGEILEIKVHPTTFKEKNLFGEEVQIFMIGIAALR